MLLPFTVYGNTKYFMWTNLFASVFAMALLLIYREFNRIDLPTVIISTLSGLMLVLSSVCSLYAMKSGTMAISTIFSTAGLLVPCIAGIFLYNEMMGVMQWGVILFLASSCLLIGVSKRMNAGFSVKTVLLLVGSLLSNGMVMLMQTMFSREVEGGSVTAVSFLSFAIPTLLLLLIMGGFRIRLQDSHPEPLQKKLMLFAVISAAAVFLINQFATTAAGSVEPVILFTFINGGNTIIAAVMAAVLFKEKLTVQSVIGILLGVGALILVKAF